MTDAATAPLRVAWGWGLASIHASGQMLDTYFPSPRLGLADNSAAPEALISAVIDDEAREVRTELVMVEIDLDAPPASTSDAYLEAAPPQPSVGEAAPPQPGRHLWVTPQRRMDLRRSLCHRGIRKGPHPAARSWRTSHHLRG